ncbi:unnamed protein product [Protopolystoma xenopodis]|uniref:Uncharacterized protein n=1 Tax=Protopolystoma xenopodis TaxID=117903 RepID=A0A3S5AMR4_9PLAT|nr:unnamed protein product [Protopolystoma xenopodis]
MMAIVYLNVRKESAKITSLRASLLYFPFLDSFPPPAIIRPDQPSLISPLCRPNTEHHRASHVEICITSPDQNSTIASGVSNTTNIHNIANTTMAITTTTNCNSDSDFNSLIHTVAMPISDIPGFTVSSNSARASFASEAEGYETGISDASLQRVGSLNSAPERGSLSNKLVSPPSSPPSWSGAKKSAGGTSSTFAAAISGTNDAFAISEVGSRSASSNAPKSDAPGSGFSGAWQSGLFPTGSSAGPGPYMGPLGGSTPLGSNFSTTNATSVPVSLVSAPVAPTNSNSPLVAASLQPNRIDAPITNYLPWLRGGAPVALQG